MVEAADAGICIQSYQMTTKIKLHFVRLFFRLVLALVSWTVGH
jgi:hypothetical protein